MTNYKLQKGQSMVEMVIAIAIILTGLVGALALTISNLAGSQEAGTRVVATNLAREGIDAARSIRDTNWLKNLAWDDGLYSGSDFTAIAVFNPAANTWQLDFLPDNVTDPATKLYRQTETDAYTTLSEGGTQTLYSRLLTFDPICFNSTTKIETIKTSGDSCGADEKIGIRVESEVAWTESGRPHLITLEDRLYNWK